MADRAVALSRSTRRWVGPVAVAAVAAAGCLYLQWQNPTATGAALPECPTKMLTGLDCPLCGSLRCVHSLSGGQWSAALHDNLLLVVALPVLLVLWCRWLAASLTGAPFRVQLGRRTAYAVIAVAAAWMVLRNLPVWPLHPVG